LTEAPDELRAGDRAGHRRDVRHRPGDRAVVQVARVIAYLAGEDARPVTGTALAVDAGRVATL